MILLGLTGSIGMGKSATAEMFRAHGIPVYDADAAVHALYDGGAAVAPVGEAFPGSVRDGVVDRARLGEMVLDDGAALRRLEDIVHPLVRAGQSEFLARARAGGARAAILEVPLLMETGAAACCDAVVVTTAPGEVQRERVLARPDMSEEKLAAILAKQMPDAQKRARAHFLVETQHGFAAAQKQVDDIVCALSSVMAGAMQRFDRI